MEISIKATNPSEARAAIDMLNVYIDQAQLEGPGVGESITELLQFGMHTRSYNALKMERIDTIAELLKYPRIDLIKIPNLGKRGAEELVQALENWKQAQAKP